MNKETTYVATASQTAGPFFHLGLGPHAGGATAGERIRVLVTVTDGDGRPVDDALIELWQTADSKTPALFARMPTGHDGSCEIETVRAPHINVCLFARGLLRHVHTRIYFAGDPALESDPVLSIVPEHRRQTLLARPDPDTPGRWLFDVRFQGPQETVFFDL